MSLFPWQLSLWRFLKSRAALLQRTTGPVAIMVCAALTAGCQERIDCAVGNDSWCAADLPIALIGDTLVDRSQPQAALSLKLSDALTLSPNETHLGLTLSQIQNGNRKSLLGQDPNTGLDRDIELPRANGETAWSVTLGAAPALAQFSLADLACGPATVTLGAGAIEDAPGRYHQHGTTNWTVTDTTFQHWALKISSTAQTGATPLPCDLVQMSLLSSGLSNGSILLGTNIDKPSLCKPVILRSASITGGSPSSVKYEEPPPIMGAGPVYLLAGSTASTVYLFEKEPDSTFTLKECTAVTGAADLSSQHCTATQPAIRTKNSAPARSIAVDRSGTLLAMVNSDGSLALYDLKTHLPFSLPAEVPQTNQQVAFIDLDGDGKPDIVATQASAPPTLLINQSNGFTTHPSLAQKLFNASSALGQTDAVIASGLIQKCGAAVLLIASGGAKATIVAIHGTTGAPLESAQRLVSTRLPDGIFTLPNGFGLARITSLMLADLNADGLDDLFIGTTSIDNMDQPNYSVTLSISLAQ